MEVNPGSSAGCLWARGAELEIGRRGESWELSCAVHLSVDLPIGAALPCNGLVRLLKSLAATMTTVRLRLLSLSVGEGVFERRYGGTLECCSGFQFGKMGFWFTPSLVSSGDSREIGEALAPDEGSPHPAISSVLQGYDVLWLLEHPAGFNLVFFGIHSPSSIPSCWLPTTTLV